MFNYDLLRRKQTAQFLSIHISILSYWERDNILISINLNENISLNSDIVKIMIKFD